MNCVVYVNTSCLLFIAVAFKNYNDCKEVS